MRPEEDLPAALRVLHREIDREAGALAQRHAARLQCRRGCSSCCVDDLTVFEIEAERIRSRNGPLLRGESPHPPGACAFLDGDGGCRIYDDRPYVCRTQGLPLRWTEDELEYRDICPLNDETGAPLESLPVEFCWTLGPYEGRLASLEQKRGGEMKRVALRSLFQRT